jgi:arylsulfatase A-like enzyme
MAELMNVEPFRKWDGQSYADTVRTGVRQGRDYLVLSQQAHVCQRSARFGDWVYIRTIHDGFHLFPREMLYNVKDDPYEQNNIADKRPEICGEGARLLMEWHESMMLISDSEIDPMWTVIKEGGPEHTRGHLDAYLDRLEVTGRAEGAARLRERYKRV